MADEHDDQGRPDPAPGAAGDPEALAAQAEAARKARREERIARREKAAKEAEAARAARIAAGKHYTGIEAVGHRAFQTVAVAAGIAGVFAAITWLSEHNDRMEEREARKAGLIDSAYRAIADLRPEKGETLRMSQRLQWAFDTLSRYGQTIEVTADSIDLAGADLVCGTYFFRATKSILIADALIVDSRVLVDAPNSFVQGDISTSLISDTVPGYVGGPHSTVFSGRASRAAFVVGGAAAFDLEADQVAVQTEEGGFMFEGAPGLLLTTEEDRVGPYWPVFIESEESWQRRNALPGDDPAANLGAFTGTPVLEPSPAKRPAESNDTMGKLTPAFAALCPRGVCPPAQPWTPPATNPSCDPIADNMLIAEQRMKRGREYREGFGDLPLPMMWVQSRLPAAQPDPLPDRPDTPPWPGADPI